VGRLAVSNDVKLLDRDSFDNDRMGLLVGRKPSFSLLPGGCDGTFVPWHGDCGKSSCAIQALDLLARSELGNGGRIIIGTVNILPVAGGIEVEY